MNSHGTSVESLWSIEEACRNAYPAREITIEGWLLRSAGGRSRRTNSVNPLRGGPADPTKAMALLEAACAGLGRPLVFRVPGFATATMAAIERLGFIETSRNRTLWAPITALPTERDPGVTIVRMPEPRWFDAWAGLNASVSPADVTAFHASVGALLLPAGFAVRHVDGQPVALAYGAVHGGVLVIEAVVTRAERRRQGHARALLRALLAWARSMGASGACLQVAADNAAGIALYRTIGFDQDLYDYSYHALPGRR